MAVHRTTMAVAGGGGGGAAHSAKCSGAITATFTWHKTGSHDYPPETVIVEEDVSAKATYFGAKPTGTGSAVADNGIGSSAVIVNNPTPGGLDYEITSSGTKYTIKNSPGTSFTMIGSPTATSSVTLGSCTAGVSYSAIPLVVSINLTGTSPANPDDGSTNILIGQGSTASLTAPGVTFQNYTWDWSLKTFGSFNVSADQSRGYVGPGNFPGDTHPTIHLYWNEDGTETVKVQATAYIAGQAIGAVTAGHEVYVWVPYYMNYPTAGPTTISGDTIRAGDPNKPVAGINFDAAVGTPALFRSAGTGSAQWVQLCNLYHKQFRNIGPANVSVTDGFELDNVYPYNIIWPADSTADKRRPINADDSPDIDAISSGIQQVQVQDEFKMYLMHLPPGSDVQWVSLNLTEWHWNVDTSRSGATWSPDPPGKVLVISDRRCIYHPEWQLRYTNTNQD